MHTLQKPAIRCFLSALCINITYIGNYVQHISSNILIIDSNTERFKLPSMTKEKLSNFSTAFCKFKLVFLAIDNSINLLSVALSPTSDLMQDIDNSELLTTDFYAHCATHRSFLSIFCSLGQILSCNRRNFTILI